ncbi:hypothetical protein [Calycomorphotria hydatis]|uniref:hypothetical protein n=1 Tax=Calycomorphotria hydatis TaxID=2528027 RepID=UPI0011A65E38|nr:hypothetical protein [Calycomorphotria hydatis]
MRNTEKSKARSAMSSGPSSFNTQRVPDDYDLQPSSQQPLLQSQEPVIGQSQSLSHLHSAQGQAVSPAVGELPLSTIPVVVAKAKLNIPTVNFNMGKFLIGFMND